MDGGTSRMLVRAQSAGAGSDDLSGALLARRRRTFDAAASSFFALETPDTRPEAEALIRTAFMRAYGARIERFLPLLMGLRDGEGSLLAACGLRHAALSPLFPEAYLDRPVEAALSATAGETLRRGDVIEVGNLAVARAGHAPLLIAALTRHLHESGQRWVVVTAVPALDNSPAWIVSDLAAMSAGIPTVPLPPGTVKITYTSGTTGDSRGVCLDQSLLDRVAAALAAAAAFTAADRHFCVLPLATLLENVAGLYAPILAGACCLVPPPADAGMTGSSGFDALRLIHGVARRGATTAILLPQLLKGLTAVADAERRRLRSLRYVAVGGSRVAPALLASARDVGLPVYEGYGLSEWVESELEAQPGIARAAVYGDSRPWCAAVIASPLTGSDEGRARIAALVAAANRALPDYAQVHAWVPADAPFSAVRGELTANGRLRRDVIWQRYGARIDRLYGEALHGVL